MKLSFSRLPKYPWWGHGTPAYENNLAMKLGNVPVQKIVEEEHARGLDVLKKYADIELFPFPLELDANGLNKHDAVFTRDAFISDQKGLVIISNFSERERQAEAEARTPLLSSLGFKTVRLPEDAFAEGGEFYYVPKDNILFAGGCRNNKKGVEEVAKHLKAKDVCIVESDSFHLDTLFTILLDKQGHLVGIIVCWELIKNKEAVQQFAKKHNIEILEVMPIDTVGFDGKGKISVNCVALPGVLLGGSLFETQGIEEKIKKMGIEHAVTPVSQFLLSGGGIHCLANELRM